VRVIGRVEARCGRRAAPEVAAQAVREHRCASGTARKSRRPPRRKRSAGRSPKASALRSSHCATFIVSESLTQRPAPEPLTLI
jgi:hypothetical protein